MSTLEALADWASSLRASDVPARVLDACRDQRRSVLAAIAAALHDDASGRVLSTLERSAAEGPAPLAGTGRRARVEDALYASTALSMAQDFDDYLCFGHTGHSAVLVPMLLAAETGASGEGQLVAQVAANEIEARLGGACLVGPLNGQMWSFIHAVGAAVAAGRLLGLDRSRLAHAMAIALAQAPHPTVPGFMGPDTKLLTAAEPSLVGLRAARLAACDATGPLDVLDHPQGFFAAFSHVPLRAFLGGLGAGFATDTLAVKPYPGCAYVDTTVDALLSLDLPEPDAIEAIDVEASLLTFVMNALSRPYCDPMPSSVAVNFSIPWTVAAAVHGRRLGPDELRRERIAALGPLAARVRLRHDWSLTAKAAKAFAQITVPGFARTDPKAIAAAVLRLRAEHPPLPLGLATAPALWSILPALREGARLPPWSADAIERFVFTFPARVRLRTRDGRVREAQVDVPRGAGPTRERTSREKLATHGPRAWGDECTRALAAAIDADDAELARFLAATRRSDAVGAGARNQTRSMTTALP